jgi:metal-sulfur cluster biosynthetic enzyme
MVARAAARGGAVVTPSESIIRTRLDTILDPCSVRMGKPRGLVGMGLVESIAIDAEAIRIRLVLTGPGCYFYFQFADAITDALAPIAGGRQVDVAIDDTVVWTKDRMSAIPIRAMA